MRRQLKRKWNLLLFLLRAGLVIGLLALAIDASGILTNLVSNPLSLPKLPLPLWVTLLVIITILLIVLQGLKDRLFPPGTPQHGYSPEQRGELLKRVNTRIQAYLESFLHNLSDIISLDLLERPDAIANFQQLHVSGQQHNQQSPPILHGTPISQVFENAGRCLLILGEPGSGKTTLLWELARKLLGQARGVRNAPIPVFFRLTSWAEEELPLKEWLANQLHTEYQVQPATTAEAFIAGDAIVPLLDGLDEMPEGKREACIRAINLYLENSMSSLVISSRQSEYFAQRERLVLGSAVVIQPPSFSKIEEYLTNAGEEWKPLLSELNADPKLQELVRIPLMLSLLMELLPKRKKRGQLKLGGQGGDQQERLLSEYVNHMLASRKGDRRYEPDELARRLSWLAGQMQQHNLTEFRLDSLQVDWLPGHQLHRWYHRSMRLFIPIYVCVYSLAMGLANAIRWGLYGGLVLGLIGGLIYGVSSGSGSGGPVRGLAFGLLGGVTCGCIGWLISGLRGISYAVDRSRKRYGLSYGLTGGLAFGAIGWMGSGLIVWLSGDVNRGLIFGLIYGVGSSLIVLVRGKWFNLADMVEDALKYGVYGGVAIGLVSGAKLIADINGKWVNEVLAHLAGNFLNDWLFNMTLGLVCIICFRLIDGLIHLIRPHSMMDDYYYERRHGLGRVLMCWLAGGLVYWLMSSLDFSLISHNHVIAIILIDGLLYILFVSVSAAKLRYRLLPTWQVDALAGGLGYGLVGGLVYGLMAVFNFRPIPAMGSMLTAGTSNGLVYGLVAVLCCNLIGYESVIAPLRAKGHSRGAVFMVGLLFGVGCGLFVVLLNRLNIEMQSEVGVELVYGFSGVFVFFLTGCLSGEIGGGLFLGLLYGLGYGLLDWQGGELINGLVHLPIFGTHGGLLSGLSFGLVSGLVDGATVGFIGGLMMGILTGLVDGLGGGELVESLSGDLIGSHTDSHYPFSFPRYFVLHFLLWHADCIPWNIRRFLNTAVDCGLLCKVGSGYTFLHPLVQHYFASLREQQPHSVASWGVK